MTDKFSKAGLRGLRTRDRIKAMHAAAPPGVRVVPANDEGRRILRHPKAGGFPKSGSVEWPNDRFTKRRLADGSVTQEQPPPEEKKPASKRGEPNEAA